MHQFTGWHEIWHAWYPLIIIVGFSVPGWIGEKLRVHHKRRLALAKIQAEAKVTYDLRVMSPPKIEGCLHRKVTDVRNADGKLVSWVCMNPDCGAQFEPDHDFEEEQWRK